MKRYRIAKGLKPFEFLGLKGNWVFILFGGVILIMIIFYLLQMTGLGVFVLIPALVFLVAFIFLVFYVSHKYGQHGLMKKIAASRRPKYLVIRSTHVFECIDNLKRSNDD